MATARVHVAWLAFLLVSACGPMAEEEDLGSFGEGKSDFTTLQLEDIYLARQGSKGSTRRFRISGSGAFKISFRQATSSTGRARLSLERQEGELLAESEAEPAPRLTYRPEETGVVRYVVEIANQSSSAMTGTLTIEPAAVEPANDKLQYKSYRVLFTNPVCKTYSYSSPVPRAGGQGTVEAKPKNVYCMPSDAGASGARPSSPQYALLEWLKPLQAGDEVFMAYLSFSNKVVGAELCAAAKRGAKVTFILDAPTDQSAALESCGGKIILRGHKGGVGYAHNKIVLINPNGEDDFMKMAFSSGNMSSGVVLHHENWHFLEVKRKSYFAEAHLCLMKAQLSETQSASIAAYREATNACRAAIPFPRETDISAFFVPNPDDGKAAMSLVVDYIRSARRISIGAHRFGNTTIIGNLDSRLRQTANPVEVRMVADDDLYWCNPLVGEPEKVGDNETWEADNVSRLWRAGAQGQRFRIKYMETNHGMHLLHHNKFIIFESAPGKPDAVLYGAANLTNTGYYTGSSGESPNFENNYFSSIPLVVKAFREQYARFWDGQKASPDEEEPPRATLPEDMPATNLLPE